EMPTSKSLALFAPQKKPKEIFAPMRQITNSLIERNALKGPGTMFKGQQLNTADHYLGKGTAAVAEEKRAYSPQGGAEGKASKVALPGEASGVQESSKSRTKPRAALEMPTLPAKRFAKRDDIFAPAGQTTQMIIGAGGETDQSILTTSENLYRAFKMKRVYYSAYVPVLESPVLPDMKTAPPLAREHRIYQADWLLRFYGFSVKELFNGSDDNLDPDLDPKVTWALRNLERFPIEVNKASYEMLMRIPGIGAVSAKRIVRQRKVAAVRFDDLKKMGVVIKRAKYFLTCCGRYYGERRFEPETIRNSILQMENGLQISMFDNNWNRLEEGARREKLSSAGVI
ncbi:MAG: helix-hairpin-helix domain-containing protein, partial [Bacillota bacterium]|nr:helix-hairpin-helix domain-containing protein [Bacillota bacterium]